MFQLGIIGVQSAPVILWLSLTTLLGAVLPGFYLHSHQVKLVYSVTGWLHWTHDYFPSQWQIKAASAQMWIQPQTVNGTFISLKVGDSQVFNSWFLAQKQSWAIKAVISSVLRKFRLTAIDGCGEVYARYTRVIPDQAYTSCINTLRHLSWLLPLGCWLGMVL